MNDANENAGYEMCVQAAPVEEQTAIVSQPVTPMDLLAKAQHEGASLESMERLYDLYLKYEANEAKTKKHKAGADGVDKDGNVRKNAVT